MHVHSMMHIIIAKVCAQKFGSMIEIWNSVPTPRILQKLPAQAKVIYSIRFGLNWAIPPQKGTTNGCTFSAVTKEQPMVVHSQLSPRNNQWLYILSCHQGTTNGCTFSAVTKEQPMVVHSQLSPRNLQQGRLLGVTCSTFMLSCCFHQLDLVLPPWIYICIVNPQGVSWIYTNITCASVGGMQLENGFVGCLFFCFFLLHFLGHGCHGCLYMYPVTFICPWSGRSCSVCSHGHNFPWQSIIAWWPGPRGTVPGGGTVRGGVLVYALQCQVSYLPMQLNRVLSAKWHLIFLPVLSFHFTHVQAGCQLISGPQGIEIEKP